MPDLTDDGWRPVDAVTPQSTYLRTKREGEDGENVCACLLGPGETEFEWFERGPSGRTTTTHHTFAAPTHWKPLEE